MFKMKIVSLFALLVFTSYFSFSQTIEAKFPKGDSAWKLYLDKNINQKIPVVNGAPLGEYIVVVNFMIDIKGEISLAFASTKNGYGMEDEAIRVIKDSPKWIPAKTKGVLDKAYRRQTITFIVSTE